MVYVRLDGDVSSEDSCLGSADVKRQYNIDEKIGEGAYGEVYRARTKADDVPVALKRVKMESEGDWLPTTALREIAILKELHHPNIVSLNNVHICDDKSLYLEFEFVDMDLKKFMAQQPEVLYNPMNIKRVLYQILRAVSYCHERRILHRDLKPQNILVDGQSHKVKLADFGLARVVTLPARAYTHEVVTLWYRAPEILLGAKTYTTAVDIWSVGCIFAEMCNLGEPLFKGESEIAQLFSIFKGLGTPTEATWPGVSNLTYMMEHLPQWSKVDLRAQMPTMENDAWDLLSKMLIYPPFERISADEALKHPYFVDLDIAKFDA